MPRVGTLGNPRPYTIFGNFAGLPFWPGGLTLLAAAPGVGKTSWLLRILEQAAASGLPAALGCYEHTAEELKFRLSLQAEASVAGAHGRADQAQVEARLAKAGEAVLLELSDQHDTVRALEDSLLLDYSFPRQGLALVAVDYLSRIPVVGQTGLLPEARRGGQAATALRELSRRHGWAIITAAALRTEAFEQGAGLSSLLGDERVAYAADRALLMRRAGPVRACGCAALEVDTLKDRSGPARTWRMQFWGGRFFPALEGEFERHG
jgi:hypothetical protein